MVNRTRKIVLRVPVTPVERKLIEQNMALLHTINCSAYARKLDMGVYVYVSAMRLNCMGPVYAQDIEDIKGALAQIWQLQRYILSSQR